MLENELMSKHTSWRIGGPARFYVVADTKEEMIEAVNKAETDGLPWAVFGGGSNLLVADEGFGGVLIQAANRKIEIQDTRVKAESGAITALVARQSVNAGLTGFEWAAGVPGTMGGAIYGNAGCFGGEMRETLVSVEAYRVRDHKRITLTNAECRYGYRESFFKHERHVILGCELELRRSSDIFASKARVEEIVNLRKQKQPLDQSSAGSVFKNYDFKDEKELEILKRHVDQIPPEMLVQKRLAAGWLVEQVDMKGYQIGAAKVSDKHGNFFVNTGGAKASELIALISYVKMKVRDELGIELQEEVQYVGF